MQVKGTSFNDRQENSAKAKLELLKRAREKSPMNDPNFAQRMAEKAAAAAVREKERAERKAAKESNLMTVLCADSEVQPVINTGTLYN